MSAAHTPGPWLAAARASSIVGLPVVGTPSGRSVASVTFFGLSKDFESRKGFESHDEESYANARLIAAAPQILAALEACVESLKLVAQEITKSRNGEFEAWSHPANSIRMANAAIAKAVQS